MKNNLWIMLFSVVVTFSSCITAAQFNNAEDDVYYSPKASNQKQPVIIPEVDVDEIIKQNPPQYGQPTNRNDEYDNTNPNAAQYYPAYRAYQDSVNSQNPRVSYNYVDPDMGYESEAEEADRLRRMYDGGSSGNWNVGLGWSWWGPTVSVGYSNYNNGYYGYNGWNNPYYGYNGFYDPWLYPSYGWGYNSFYNPYYNWGWGYNNWYGPGYGWGGYYNPWWGGGYYCRPGNNWNNGGYWNGEGVNNNPSQSRPRQAVGGNTPPASNGGGRSSTNNSSNGMYTAPAQSNQDAQQAPAGQQNTGRSGNTTYKPTTPSQSLQKVNGRQVYTRPTTTQPAQQNTNTTPTYQAPTRSTNTRSTNTRSTGGNTNYQNTQPSYSTPTRTPAGNGGRSSGGNSGSRSSGGNSGSSGGAGRRR